MRVFTNKRQLLKRTKKTKERKLHSFPNKQRGYLDIQHQPSSSTSSSSSSSQSLEADLEQNGDISCCCSHSSCLSKNTTMKALFFRNISMEPNTIEHFPEWEPIPYKGSALATLVILTLITVLLTPSIFLNRIGIELKPTTSQLCQAHDANGVKDEILKTSEKIENITDLKLAEKQYNYTLELRNALFADVELYGTKNYTCKEKTKDAWSEEKEGASYFTEWCEVWKQNELDRHKKKTCIQPDACEIACIHHFGSLSKCELGNVTACPLPIVYACHTDPDLVKQEIDLYKFQLESSEREQRIQAMKRTSSEKDDTLFIKNTQDEANDLLESIINQVNLASHLYIGYLFLSMIFPSPIILFKAKDYVRFKRIVFGLQKGTFITLVLCIWWGYCYFRNIFSNPGFMLYLNNMRNNPCYVDPTFVEMKQSLILETCEDLTRKRTSFAVLKEEIDLVLYKGDFVYDTCDCGLPIKDMANFLSIPRKFYGIEGEPSAFQEISMTYRYIPGKGSNLVTANGYDVHGFYAPSLGAEFLANMTVCNDINFATRELHTASKTNAEWMTLWMTSGTFILMFAKIIIANFCMSLIKAADPLGMIGGMFESPAQSYFDARKVNIEELQKEKYLVLKTFAIWGCVIWGIFTQLLVANLFVTAMKVNSSNKVYSHEKDIIVGSLSVFAAVLMPFFGFFVVSSMKKKILATK